MTNTYLTGNPLGSSAAKDLSDNASDFDEAMNSTSPSFYDRFMKRRETWAGMEKMVSDFLETMGFEPTHLVYVDGTPLTVNRPTQLIDRAGSVYKVKQPASFPVNLTGTWSTDQLLLVDVGDASLRAALAGPTGATLVTDGTKTVSEKLGVIRRKTIDEYYIAGQTNWDLAMAAARADWDLSPTPMRLVFTAGIYEYTECPDWAKQDCEVIGEGEVRFRYSGTGTAFILDAGTTAPDLVYNMTVGPFIIEAPDSAGDGVFIRSVHHSDIDLTVRGAGASSAGIRINFAVCNTLKLTCSVNQEGWYLGAMPLVGIVMDKRLPFEQTAYNTFINPIFEGLPTNISMPNALGNGVHGGTAEAGVIGINIAATSYANKFYGIDLEANSSVDIYCEGYGNDFVSVDSDNYCVFTLGANSNVVSGGNFKSLDFEASALGNVAIGARINRSNTGGTLTVLGNNRNIACFDTGAGAWLPDVTGPHTVAAYAPPSLANGASTSVTITVPGAQVGMFVRVAYSVAIAGLEIDAWVSVADNVIVQIVNRTGATVSLSAGALRIKAEF